MGAAIEAPLTLLQIPEETVFADSIEPPHVPLGLISEIFAAVDVVTTCGDEEGYRRREGLYWAILVDSLKGDRSHRQYCSICDINEVCHNRNFPHRKLL
jgi:hypothetical protein